MNQHWDNLYSQTQDLYGISPNHFIQQIEQIRFQLWEKLLL